MAWAGLTAAGLDYGLVAETRQGAVAQGGQLPSRRRLS
jgi:hypothetical protein